MPDFKPTMKDYKKLTPFKFQILQSFPFIAEDFDSLTNYELLCKVVEYLNDVINNENNVEDNVTNLYNSFVELQDYVNNYFDSLEVAEEINNKLDNMANDGTLTSLISNYINDEIQPQINIQNNAIREIDAKVTASTSSTPIAVSNTSEMTDTTKIYVNTSDGNWYYYNGTEWTIGGIYQSTGISNNSIGLNELKNEVINDRYTNTNINLFNPFKAQNDTAIRSSDGLIFIDSNFWISDKIFIPAGESIRVIKYVEFQKRLSNNFTMYKVAFFDENNVFSHVLTRINDLITNDTSNDLYCYIQIEKSELSYENRFNIMAYDCNEETEPRKPFIPYIGLNSNNIDFNIKEYDLNDSLKSRIPNFPDIEFELGTIDAQYGLNREATNRARTKIYNFYLKGNMIHPIDDTVVYNIALYDNNYNFIKTTDWIKGRDYIFNNEIARIMIKYDNDNEINDINNLKNKFIFTGNLNNFYDTLKNYGMSNFTNYINYTGDRIILENKARYNKLDFKSMYQDACCYNEYMFIFNNEGKFYIRNLKENTSTPIYKLDQNDNIKPHCNTVFFGKEKYSNDDLFPILYVNAYNTQNLPLGTLYAHRVMYDSDNNNYYTVLLQTITIGFTNNEIWTIPGDIRPYGNFILDTDNNKLYAFTLRGNNTRFFKFNMPEISIGNFVTLNQIDILDMFDLDYFPYIQGTLYINNMLLCLSGNNAILDNSSCLHVVDLVNQKEINKINLSSIMSEPEAITYYNDYLYIAESTFFKFTL